MERPAQLGDPKNRKLRILLHTHRYPPVYMAGGELMCHRILKWFQEQGHEIRVLTTWGKTCVYEGIQVLHRTKVSDESQLYDWCDIVWAHLNSFPRANQLSRNYRRPLLGVVHNPPQIKMMGMRENSCKFALFNSAWCQQDSKWSGDWSIVQPPLRTADWKRAVGGQYITLINLNRNKGGEILYRLAKMMPRRKFMGVIGSYDDQIIKKMPNVRIHPHTTNIQDVYNQSRIVLMPSGYETWGMVAAEAAACGLPVICTPTKGLTECLGDAGLFASRHLLDAYQMFIKQMDDPAAYARQSEKMLARAAQMEQDNFDQLKAFERKLQVMLNYKTERRILEMKSVKDGVKIKALRGFIGREGKVKAGETFFTTTERAKQLVAARRAEYIPAKMERKVVSPSETKKKVKDVQAANPVEKVSPEKEEEVNPGIQHTTCSEATADSGDQVDTPDEVAPKKGKKKAKSVNAND